MKKHFSPRIQLLSTAASLAVISSILGVTAFETYKTDVMRSTLQMREGTEFGIDIQTDKFQENETIIPDGTAAYDPYITNKGNYDVYTFIEISSDNNAFEIDPGDGWTKLNVTDRNIYAYGDSNTMTVLKSIHNNVPDETSKLCSTVKLNKTEDMEQGPYSIYATGYAIQTDGIGTSDPLSVWNKLDGGSE